MSNSQSSLFMRIAVFALPLLLVGIGGLTPYLALHQDPWIRDVLPQTPIDPIRISQVNFNSSLLDPTGDQIFVEGINDETYSYRLFDDSWLQAESTVDSMDNPRITTCAPDWLGAPPTSDAEIWDPPPVNTSILDSAGIRFERPLSIVVRCYVLLEDGRLEVWSRDDEVGHIIALTFTSWMLGCIGGVVGIIVSVLVTKATKKNILRT